MPSPTTTLAEGQVNGMASSMSAAELRYQSIVNSADDHFAPSSEEEFEGYVAPAWAFDSTSALDCLDMVLPFEEEILEVIMGIDRPWEDLHHRSYFLPPLQEVESRFSELFTSDLYMVSNPLAPTHFRAEGNMSVISKMISINILRNPKVVKNIFIGAECSPEEIQV